MLVLGPAPACAFGVLAMFVDGLHRRIRPLPWLNNLATYAAFPLVGAFLARALLSGQLHHSAYLRGHGLALGLTAATVFSPVRMRCTAVRLNSALQTRRPSAFRG